MKRIIAISSVLLIVLTAAVLRYRGNPDRTPDEYESVYNEYDRECRAYLANATRTVEKETIKIERLSDTFTVPQKLTIQGTPPPPEIGRRQM